MKNYKILLFGILILNSFNSAISQEYDEQKTKLQVEKFKENPKLYYDKIKALTDKLEQANQNTLKVSEEYLLLLDKKDSIIAIYKNQLAKAKMNSSRSTAQPIVPSKPLQEAASTIVEPKKEVLQESPYRVQLAAFKREDFVNFFTKSTKTFGVEKLENRSVMEIHGFNTSEEAYEFSKKMRTLGFPGAFVTKYDNGVRADNYNYLAKSGLKSSEASTPTKMTDSKLAKAKELENLDYPNYIPLGYQELMGDKSKQMLQAAMTPPALKNIPPPLTKFSPNKFDIDRTNAIPEGSILPTSTPKTVIGSKQSTTSTSSGGTKNTPTLKTPGGKPSAEKTKPTPPTTTDDQLDAAFDQLFKK